MVEGKRIGDCSILVAECLAIQEVLVMTTQNDLHRIIIESDSQLVINVVHGKRSIPKDIINLIENIKWLFKLIKGLV